MKNINIQFKDIEGFKNIEVESQKLIYILSKLEGEELSDSLSEEEINKLMKKYNLFDDFFLNNIKNL